MALRQVGAGSSLGAKISAVFAGAAILLAPAMNCTGAKETLSRRVEEPAQSVFTNGKTTITLNGDRVRLESIERGGYWSIEADVKDVKNIDGIIMLAIDWGGAVTEGIAMPADALTANNMRDAGAPGEAETSVILVPDSGSQAGKKMLMAHELTHALFSRLARKLGIEEMNETAREALAYSAQIAYGDARAGLADLLDKLKPGTDRVFENVARRLMGEFAAHLGKDLRFASDRELEDAAKAFLDKICMYEFGEPFARVVDTAAYSGL